VNENSAIENIRAPQGSDSRIPHLVLLRNHRGPYRDGMPLRTYGPIHFEDLDAHQFEYLIQGLVSDFKDRQSIEVTGRGGANGSIDIRAYEKTIGGEPSGSSARRR